MHEQRRHPAGRPDTARSPLSPPPKPEVRGEVATVKISGWSLGRPPSVLVIDDDDLMREMLAETLEAVGCDVTQSHTTVTWMIDCANGALKEAESHYDLVISDIRMPGMDGLTVLESMTELHDQPPTILITAYGDTQTHDRAMRAGATIVLDKPFSIQTLLSWVDRILGSSN